MVGPAAAVPYAAAGVAWSAQGALIYLGVAVLLAWLLGLFPPRR